MSRSSKTKEKKLIHLIANNSQSPVTEQYRLIRNNIHFSSADKDINSIVITSAGASEGKSTTAANLAIVLAQQGKPVILVDTDLRKPSVHYTFRVSNLYGLTNILKKEHELEATVMNTIIPNLDILTSGPIPPNPSELLESKAMENVIEMLREKYEYIIFDTPPVLSVTDPQIMANKCDGVVIVVASGRTKKDQALKAKEILEKTSSMLLGIVVNGVEPKKNNFYGQYK